MPRVEYDFMFQLVESYAELDGWLTHHATSDDRLMMVIGPPGVGKTEAVARKLADLKVGYSVLKGRNTPVQFYEHLYAHRDDELCVIDDCRTFLRNPYGIELLMAVTDSKRPNRVSWNTSKTGKGPEGAPKRFETNLRLVIVNNGTRAFGDDIHALADRGDVLICRFSPEVINDKATSYFTAPPAEGRGWPKKELALRQEVLGFIGAHLGEIVHLSLHDYNAALGLALNEKSGHGLDWKKVLLRDNFASKRALDAVRLNNDPSRTLEERLAEYARLHGGVSRASYCRDPESLRQEPRPGAVKPPPIPTPGGRVIVRESGLDLNTQRDLAESMAEIDRLRARLEKLGG